MALDKCNQEENHADDSGHSHGNIYDPFMDGARSDAEEENTDGDFGGNHASGVEDVAQPPKLNNVRNLWLTRGSACLLTLRALDTSPNERLVMCWPVP